MALLGAFLLVLGLLLGLAAMMRLGGAHGSVVPSQAQKAAKGRTALTAPRKPPAVKFLPARKPAALAEAEKKKDPLKPEDKLSGQVVETAKPLVQERPKDTKYLGRYDMTVEREVKSKGQKKPGQDLGRHRIDNPSALQSPQSDSTEPTRIPKVAQKHKKPSGGPQEQVAGAAAPTRGPGPRPAQAEEDVPKSGSPLVNGPGQGLLLPATSASNVARNIQALAGNPGGNDYLPDVEDEGDTTLLNTRQFRYWDFFHRVKEKVAGEWDAGKVWRSRDPTGNRYGVKNRLTVLHVTLDAEGALKHLQVVRESGLDFLDDEARRAFTAASPFPNPPSGLRNKAGDVEFQFSFLLEISTQRFKFRGFQ